jgi:hypothetical protein
VRRPDAQRAPLTVSVMVVAGVTRPLATGARCDGEMRIEIMSEDIRIREVDGRTFELKTTWRGSGFEVRETTGGKSMPLTREVDLPDEDLLTDEVLLAMTEPRRVGLAAMMQQYNIVSGPDYQYEETYELLYSTTPVGRYVQVAGDETYHWLSVCETREEAAEAVRYNIVGQYGDEYPHHPVEIRDLDTGRSIGFKYEVVVELTD